MLDLTHWPLSERAQIAGVITDIDDTLTTDGAITQDAWQALVALKSAGLPVFAITGRPVGWSADLMRGTASQGQAPCPVDAIVAENGAVALLPGQAAGGLQKRYQLDALTRQMHFERLQQVLARIEREVPGARRAQDSAGRETDIAIDHSEFTRLPGQAIAQVVALMRAEGLQATVSSIHINGWIGSHNKLDGARWIVREQLGRDLDDEAQQWVCVGDSTNDELLFAHFPNSVGVANIARFRAALTHLPRYVTRGERGAGFAEMALALLAARPGAA